MESDEAFAQKLQEEFDRDARNVEDQYENDAHLAQQLAKESHAVSDSGSEDEANAVLEAEESIGKSPAFLVSSSSGINENAGQNDKKSVKRPVCQYGADCYRKNSNHLSEFYHPGKAESSSSDVTTPTRLKKIRTNASPLRTPSSKNSKKPFEERLRLNDPFGFFLNKIYSIPQTQQDWQTLVFPDLLNSKLGTLIESVQLNFMLDLDFVMKFYQSCGVGKTPVLFMYGQMEGNPKDYEAVTCKKVNMPFQYGVHHTKMMIFQYREGLRVVVHTANLKPDDWEEKTQGFWVSPLFPPLADGKKSLLDGDSRTNFKRDLTEYLISYKSPELLRWSQIVKGHDFSCCSVYLIGSVPGYHVGESRYKFGHLKCRALLRKYSKWRPTANLPIITQCSSIGSLGKDSKTWFTSEFGASLSGGNETSNSSVNLVYPSLDDVMNSTQGYGGGSCLPYQSNTHERQSWILRHLHCWRSQCRLRSRSMPHIKTYTRLSADLKTAQFFLLTSSNMSKAAWGQLQKQGTQLFIRSYEVGVLWLPANVVNEDFFLVKRNDEDIEAGLNLPYDVPLTPYPSGAIPWLMNTPKKTPDILGNTYP